VTSNAWKSTCGVYRPPSAASGTPSGSRASATWALPPRIETFTTSFAKNTFEQVLELRAWLASAGITDGAVFRRVDRHGCVHGQLSAQTVRVVVRDAATRAGLDADRFAGHSLRAGLATAAAAAGVSERSIMAQAGHKSVVVARR
jgi:site-specific recombinase XerD